MAFQTLEAVLPGFSAVGQSGSGQLVKLAGVAPTGIPGGGGVTAHTGTEVGLTAITGMLATDTLVSVRKAATQAGLFLLPGDNPLGGVTGAGAASVKYVNVTAAPIVPTAAEEYTFVVLRAGSTDGVTKLGTVPTMESQGTWVPYKLSLMSPTLVTGQATNYVTITFRAYTTAAVSRTIGALAFSSAAVSLPANVEVDVPITSGAVLQSGELVDVLCAQTGSGLALPPGIIAKVELA